MYVQMCMCVCVLCYCRYCRRHCWCSLLHLYICWTLLRTAFSSLYAFHFISFHFISFHFVSVKARYFTVSKPIFSISIIGFVVHVRAAINELVVFSTHLFGSKDKIISKNVYKPACIEIWSHHPLLCIENKSRECVTAIWLRIEFVMFRCRTTISLDPLHFFPSFRYIYNIYIFLLFVKTFLWFSVCVRCVTVAQEMLSYRYIQQSSNCWR